MNKYEKYKQQHIKPIIDKQVGKNINISRLGHLRWAGQAILDEQVSRIERAAYLAILDEQLEKRQQIQTLHMTIVGK
jgi:hypothetical protein